MIWIQLSALHTFWSMWLPPHVLLVFGQRWGSQICVKCGLTLGSTLIGASTQAGFQLPAQMWLCLLCRPFKSDRDLMNRWEQAHQIWAGSVNLVCVDWHTNQWRTEREFVFAWGGGSHFAFRHDLFCSFFMLFFICCCTGRTMFSFLLVIRNRKITCRWKKWRIWSELLKWRGSRFKEALWRISCCWLGGWGGRVRRVFGAGEERRRVTSKSLQLAEARETSAPQCLLNV